MTCQYDSKDSIREKERHNFESDAAQYDFDLTRMKCAAYEPWSEYESTETGHRWAGWLAAKGIDFND